MYPKAKVQNVHVAGGFLLHRHAACSVRHGQEVDVWPSNCILKRPGGGGIVPDSRSPEPRLYKAEETIFHQSWNNQA